MNPKTTHPVHAALTELLREGGSVTQDDVARSVDVSKATVSRRLSELENDGVITRMGFRGRNLVWWADETPRVLEP